MWERGLPAEAENDDLLVARLRGLGKAVDMARHDGFFGRGAENLRVGRFEDGQAVGNVSREERGRRRRQAGLLVATRHDGFVCRCARTKTRQRHLLAEAVPTEARTEVSSAWVMIAKVSVNRGYMGRTVPRRWAACQAVGRRRGLCMRVAGMEINSRRLTGRADVMLGPDTRECL